MARRYILLGVFFVVFAFFIQLPWVKPAVKTIFIFPAKAVRTVVKSTGNFFSFLYHIKFADEENAVLKKENTELKLQNILYRARITELERFKAYQVPYRAVLCAVIARDPGNWFKTLVINKGEDDGIANNMSVFMTDGIVGRTMDVQKKTCSVLLAIDKGSKISAFADPTREFGIVEGSGEIMLMNFFTNDIKAKPGDQVFSSGLGGTFPKGLVLGRIKEIRKKGLVAQAIIQPSVDFNKIEDVFVLAK